MDKTTRLFLALFLLVASLSQFSRASAQEAEAGVLRISTPETSHFPTVQFRLDAYDAQGSFMDSLQPKDIQILEDGQSIQPQAVERIHNGLQVIIALNTSPAMAKKYGESTGFQLIQKALAEWVRSQPEVATLAADDFSLATPTGLALIRESDRTLAVRALANYQPDPARTQPALGSLAEALDLATDPLSHAFMKRSILYITPALPASSVATIADLTKRAQGIGVKVNIWQIVDPQVGGVNSPSPFEQMATATGGVFEEVNLAVPLPEIEPLFQPLRSTYQVQYTSAIQKSGSHSLSVQVKQAGLSRVSNETSFDITVHPPNPIFLSPPASIQRSWTTLDAAGTAPSLTPETVTLQIMVEFPDQHQRALKVTRLYVDGKLAAENTAEPFDRFTWSISEINAPARQTLRAEVIDVIGLSGSSIEIPVEMLVDQPVKAELSERVSVQGMVAIAAVMVAGLVLALVLLLTNRQRQARRRRQQADKRLMNDPVTQPVHIRQERARRQKEKQPAPAAPATAPAAKAPASNPPAARPAGARFSTAWTNPVWPRKNGQAAPARLVALDENEQPITGGAIPLTRQEITFGIDPQRATQVLDSPTVNDLHARLYRAPDGIFYLADQGSIAGTWINYAPVTSSGARLEHGDLIHIGRLMYRFELAEPGQSEIKVFDLERLP